MQGSILTPFQELIHVLHNPAKAGTITVHFMLGKLRHNQAKRLPNIIVKSKARTQTQVPDSHTGRYPFPELGLFTLYVPAGSEGGEMGY